MNGPNPYYTFHLCIERDDRTILDAAVDAGVSAEGISKAKKTIQRLLNEYTPDIKAKSKASAAAEEPVLPELPEAVPVPAPEIGAAPPARAPEGIKGLVSLRCGGCGDTFSTYLKEPRSEFRCKCGHYIDLTSNMARYHFTCPHCQKKNWGMTNIESADMIVACKCGRKVELLWDHEAKEYQTEGGTA